MAQLGFRTKQGARCRHAVLERKGGNGDCIVIVDDGLFGGDDIELQLKRHFATKVVHDVGELFSSVGKRVYGHCAGFAEQRHGGQQPWKSETVVAVQMAYENVIEARELEFHAPHLHLCAFAAVYHEEVVAYVEHLRRWHVSQADCG